jgi:hypothetical protein
LIVRTWVDSLVNAESEKRRLEKIIHPEPEAGILAGELLHMAMPIRWNLVGREGRANSHMACTYDVHPHGARLLSECPVSSGDMLVLERGINRAICRVIWTADPKSPLRGQFTVACVEGRAPWEEELRQMQTEELYQPVDPDARRKFNRPEANRRRRPRFYVEGEAEVTGGGQHACGEVEEISEFGARIAAAEPLRLGSDIRLMLNLFDVSVALKAQVRYLANDEGGIGVQFQEIRRGDHPLLQYVLNKVKSRRVAEFARVVVVGEPRAANGEVIF